MIIEIDNNNMEDVEHTKNIENNVTDKGQSEEQNNNPLENNDTKSVAESEHSNHSDYSEKETWRNKIRAKRSMP